MTWGSAWSVVKGFDKQKEYSISIEQGGYFKAFAQLTPYKECSGLLSNQVSKGYLSEP